jgi:hypothetical protein
VDDPVKDATFEAPVPEVWRPTLAAVVDSLARPDATVATDLPSVDPVPPATWQRCLHAVDDYGDVTLTPLPDASWETAVAL